MEKQDIQKVYNFIKTPENTVIKLHKKLDNNKYKFSFSPRRYYKKIAFLAALLVMCIIIKVTPASAQIFEYGKSILEYIGFYDNSISDLDNYMEEEEIISDNLNSKNIEVSIEDVAYSSNSVIALITVKAEGYNFNDNYKFKDIRFFYELKNDETPIERKYTLDLKNSPVGMSAHTIRVAEISNNSISYILIFDVGYNIDEISEISLVFNGFAEAYLEKTGEGAFQEKYKNESDLKWTVSWEPSYKENAETINLNKEIKYTSLIDKSTSTWIIKNVELSPFSLVCNIDTLMDPGLIGESIDSIIFLDGTIIDMKTSGEEFGFTFSDLSKSEHSLKQTIVFYKLIDPDQIKGITVSGQEILFR